MRGQKLWVSLYASVLFTGCSYRPHETAAQRLKLVIENSSQIFSRTVSSGTAVVSPGNSGVIKVNYERIPAREVLIPERVEKIDRKHPEPPPPYVTQRISEKDLVGKTPVDLDYMRAEIAARFGYTFEEKVDFDPSVRERLSKLLERGDEEGWYNPLSGNIEVIRQLMPQIPYENAKTILKYQNEQALRTFVTRQILVKVKPIATKQKSDEPKQHDTSSRTTQPSSGSSERRQSQQTQGEPCAASLVNKADVPLRYRLVRDDGTYGATLQIQPGLDNTQCVLTAQNAKVTINVATSNAQGEVIHDLQYRLIGGNPSEGGNRYVLNRNSRTGAWDVFIETPEK